MASPSQKQSAPGEFNKITNVREFFEQWSSMTRCPTFQSNEEMDEAIAAKMEIPRETVDELSEVCSISSLWEADQKFDHVDKQGVFAKVPEDIDLETVKKQITELTMRRQNPSYANHVYRKMKYSYSDWYKNFKPPVKKKKVVDKERAENGEPSLLLSIDVHKPYNGKRSSKMVISESYLVRGSNKLTELRDVIRCANDRAVAGDFSLVPDSREYECAKDFCKSGFFFIEGVFYNDMREHDNRDYSETILKWLQTDNRQERVGNFTKADMAATTFLDLNLVIGKPYFYQHQGDCEHLIIFTDMRLLHPSDPQDMKSYPYLTREMNYHRKICKACLINTAKWIVYNSHLIPHNPTFMCHRCFKCLLYDTNGQKIGNFEAFRSYEHPT